MKIKECYICNSRKLKYAFTYTKNSKSDGRRWYRCGNCFSFIAENFYRRNYYDRKYYCSDKYIAERFNYVNSLPPRKSNNFFRVKRIKEFLNIYPWFGPSSRKRKKILDVGCGFGIFLYKFLKGDRSWKGAGFDLDVKLRKHLKSLGITMVVAKDLSKIKDRFDIITLNRVLEHVKNPSALLRKVSRILKDRGIIYFEVPDVFSYSLQGKKSEAFGDDHYSVFSPESVFALINKAGFQLLNLSRIREVNDKLTIYAFCKKTE